MTAQTSAPGLAALFVLAGMMTLGLTDNFLRYVTEDSSLAQFHFIRGAFAFAMLAIAAAFGWGIIRPKKPLAVLGRSALVTGAMVIYFGCLSILPIGVVVAGLFTAPLFVVIITVLIQRQRVGPIRWAAVGVGFAGTLMVIQPDPAALDPVVFLPVVAGFLYACSAVATRAWCEGEGTLALTATFFAMLSLTGALGCLLLPGTGTGAAGFALRGWMPMTDANLFWIAVQSVGALIGIACLFRAYQVGEASFVAVFEYSLLIFASFWAYVLWQESVSLLAGLGMVLIALAGTIIAVRSDG
ncbi:EamA-like transporter family protein [Cognatiyoonia koreensis]|uniref:EamA-like transporter family protein n=1 Tax=Cognatiyoonia koreensis TaxID=364200 RepID=A0A1I0N7X8_9RHOB|nr:DMT family transporter [Cognatiyoonia koreensis]SEV96915.1 EamA-like transporter family protein [Cognatiyoonia koreensis]